MESGNTWNKLGGTGLFLYGDLTESVVQAAYSVHKVLGTGFLEKVYETALAHEFDIRGIPFQRQFPIEIYYKDITAGEYVSDFMVGEKVIVEIKAVSELNNIHMAQVMNYLKATRKKVGLLINFGSTKIQVKRIIAEK